MASGENQHRFRESGPRAILPLVLLFLFVFSCGHSSNEPAAKADSVEEKADYQSLLAEAASRMEEGKKRNDPSLYQQAFPILEKAMTLSPDRPEAYRELGNGYMEMNIFYTEGDSRKERGRKALETYNRARKSVPGFSEYDFLTAKVYLSLGQDKQAEQHLRLSVKNAPEVIDAHMELGYCLYNLGRYEEALEPYRHYLSLRKDQPLNTDAIRAKEHIGKTLAALGRMEESRVFLEKAASDYARYIETFGADNYWGCPFQSLGVLYTAMGQTSQAHASCFQSAEIQKNKYYVQAGAAILAYREGDFQTAERFIDRALQLRDRNDYRLLKGFISLAMREYDQAQEIFGTPARPEEIGILPTVKELVSDRFPRSLSKLVGQGHLAIAQQNLDLGETLFAQYLNALPTRIIEKILTADSLRKDDNPQFKGFVDECEESNTILFVYKMACLGMGWIHSNRAEHTEAIDWFQRVIDFGHQDMMGLIGKANSLAGLQRFKEADRAYEEILSVYPNNKHALAELGIVKLRLGLMADAQVNLSQARDLDKANFTCPYEGLGMLYLMQGKTKEAKENFQRAIDINPDIEYKKYNGLAKIYIDEEKYDQARALLEKSIRNYPYDNEAAEMLKRLPE